ncbi:rod shape-determining protein MreC [Candidatus Pelagibacter sp.]|nr:rod shape-determining protein MreC [Candidatus Pelagibacter sp.]
MEPSRDDFIIAIRSAFLKKGTKQRFSLLGLLFFSIILIILGKFNFIAIDYLKISMNEIIYRSSFVVSIPEKYLKLTKSSIKDHIDLYKNYNSIKKDFQKIELEKYKIEFLKAENERLKIILEDINSSPENYEKIAKVLIDKQSPFLKSIVINKGSKNYVFKGMAILHNSYLVGKVVEVNYSTSRVLLLSDLNSKIPVIIEPGGIQSIISGNGENSGNVQYKNKNKPIKQGSVIYTSGAGGLFKPGIPIGKINFSKKKGSIDFFVDFDQLRFIKILSFTKEQD